jgi:hypothetical protein
MSANETTADVVDSGSKRLYRVGGVSALVLGFAYVAIIALYVPVGPPPSGAQARLEYHAANPTVWWAILGLSVLTDLLLVPVALALYLALKGVDRDAMLVATAFIGLFVVLDLAVTWPNYASLIALGGDYASATTDSQRAAYVAGPVLVGALGETRILASVLTIAWAFLVAYRLYRLGRW